MTMTPVLAQNVVDWLKNMAPAAQLSADSRRIKPGDVFVAYAGDAGDGRNYIAQAIEAGARAVLLDTSGAFVWDTQWDVPHQAVPDLKNAAGAIASLWYGKPDADLFVVAVTGTNGKTSCTQWLGQALSHHALPTTVIGTLGVGLFNNGACKDFDITGYTTPDPLQLQRSLAEKKSQGAQALAIEASSIGLDQGRMNGLHIDVAVLTNFTRDHLDYHGDMAAYEAAKLRLFDWPGLSHAVINLDDAMGLRLLAQLKARHPAISVTGYSIEGASADGIALLAASEIRLSQQGTVFQLTTPFGAGPVRTQLVGGFNVSNVLAIAGVLFARGLEWQAVITALEALVAVPGRMQQSGGVDAPLVVIDYAHTPDALDKALQALRQAALERHGQLWCVFGCGGDRDPGKRPQMSAVALQADHLIVTSDNPRSEEPATIIEQMMAAIPAEQSDKVQVIEDRATAILSAVKHAGKQDVVLIAGKGHENYQEIKGRKLAFLDADHAALALASRATRHGGH
jgi:UDP-N-acetylmuramoyl-L-alanyl-D-glutamate--2,6-diaminopimelate ligase